MYYAVLVFLLYAWTIGKHQMYEHGMRYRLILNVCSNYQSVCLYLQVKYTAMRSKHVHNRVYNEGPLPIWTTPCREKAETQELLLAQWEKSAELSHKIIRYNEWLRKLQNNTT